MRGGGCGHDDLLVWVWDECSHALGVPKSLAMDRRATLFGAACESSCPRQHVLVRAGGRVSCGALLRGRGEQPAALASSEPAASVAAAVSAAAIAASSLAASAVASTAVAASVAASRPAAAVSAAAVSAAVSAAAVASATLAAAVASAVAATHAVAAPVAAALLGAGLGDRQRPASLRQLVGGHRRLPRCRDVGGCAGDV